MDRAGKTTLGTGATLCYSGRLDGQHHEGVGIAMDPGGGGVLPIMAYTGRFRPKGVPFSGFRYIKG